MQKPGAHSLAVRARRKQAAAVMDVQQVRLVPAAAGKDAPPKAAQFLQAHRVVFLGSGCRFGAAREASDSMALYTVGTGIGGGLVLGGALLRGYHGIAAELGHVRVVPDGHPCGCGRRGCLEQYASGSALVMIVPDAPTNRPVPPVMLCVSMRAMFGKSTDTISPWVLAKIWSPLARIEPARRS